jgi:hypothetical protein
MFHVLNHTPFQAEVAPLIDKDGREIAVCSVKATFQLPKDTIKAKIADEQLPVLFADTHFDSPENSGIKYPADLILGKPNTDIGLIGTVYSPRKKPVQKLTAALKVGSLTKKIIAYGDRFWTKSLLKPGYTKTSPIPFVRMPLKCNRLYGGKDVDRKGALRVYSANPHGTGFFVTGDKLGGSRLPNFELPEKRISSWRNRPLPATFGFSNPASPHRLKYAGTYDEAWKKEQFPLYPRDMDLRFFNYAQKDLIAKGYLTGGERVSLENLTPSGNLTFVLPSYRVTLSFHLQNNTITRSAPCHTLTIEPDENRFYMVWSSSVDIGKQRSNLKYVQADIHPSGTPET